MMHLINQFKILHHKFLATTKPTTTWLIFSSTSQPPKQATESVRTTPRRVILSFVGILLFSICQTKMDTFNGTILFQIISLWINVESGTICVTCDKLLRQNSHHHLDLYANLHLSDSLTYNNKFSKTTQHSANYQNPTPTYA
jgi:hypothetical protein